MILCSCDQAPSGSGTRNPRTEFATDFFTGYQSGQYISAEGKIYGVSTGGPTELWMRGLDNDFCLLLWGPPRNANKPGIVFISGQRCGRRKFSYNDWMVYFNKNKRTRLYLVPLPQQGNPDRGIIKLTYRKLQ